VTDEPGRGAASEPSDERCACRQAPRRPQPKS
jgi:hypothetical protein